MSTQHGDENDLLYVGNHTFNSLKLKVTCVSQIVEFEFKNNTPSSSQIFKYEMGWVAAEHGRSSPYSKQKMAFVKPGL